MWCCSSSDTSKITFANSLSLKPMLATIQGILHILNNPTCYCNDVRYPLELPLHQAIRIRGIFRDSADGEQILIHLYLDGSNLNFTSGEFFYDDMDHHHHHEGNVDQTSTFRVLLLQDECIDKSYHGIKQLIDSKVGQCYITIHSFDYDNNKILWSFTFAPTPTTTIE